jgi:photosystem II stability/assembly factor-like uncharacterized protein
VSADFRSEIRDAYEREAGRHPTPPWLRQSTIRTAIEVARQTPAPPGRLVRAGAGLLIILVGLAVVGLFLASRPTSVHSVPAGPKAVPTSPPAAGYTGPTSPIPLKMIDRNNGWAMGARRTTDAGAHWKDVSPPALPNRLGDAPEFYLDSNHAWQGQTFADRVVIFGTADGGRTWQQGAPVPVKAADPPAMSSQLYFVDDQHGWLQTGSSIAALVPPSPPNFGDLSPDPAAQGLYRTVDGGLHWTLQSTGPGAAATACFFDGGMTFISATRGWIQYGCPPAFGHSQPELLVTGDAGATWRVQPVATASRCPCRIDAPVFVDPQHGFIQGSASDGTPLLFASADGGSNWSVRTIPGQGLKGGVQLSFADASAGWAIVRAPKKGPLYPSPTCRSGYAYSLSVCFPPPQMYRTVDGGRTWARTQTDLFSPHGEVTILLFVDVQTGFALRDISSTQNMQPVLPGPPLTLELLSTNDGGRTWKVVATTIVAG